MPVFIDGHVHIYPVFSVDQFLTAAWMNFSRVAAAGKITGRPQYVLALSEGEGFDVFRRFKQQAVSSDEDFEGDNGSSLFNFYRTEEEDSLIARKGDACMVIVAGRQIISRENLELLSLFSSSPVKDRTLSLADLAAVVTANRGLPVIPWGAGKWLGVRGRVVGSLLDSKSDYPLFLGDNGNRPVFWPEDALLRRARHLRVPILSGSDPLPLASHVKRPGSFGGFIRQGELSLQHPIASLRQLLSGEPDITAFGSYVGSCQFIVEQLRINIGKRLSLNSKK